MPPQPVSHDEIYERMGYHPATAQTAVDHNSIREHYIALAMIVVDSIPPGRECSLALIALEESLMRANQAIARQVPVDKTDAAVARVLPPTAN